MLAASAGHEFRFGEALIGAAALALLSYLLVRLGAQPDDAGVALVPCGLTRGRTHGGWDLLGNLALGLATAVSVQNLLYCFVGVLLGTLIGVLPGIGPVATIAMLLPITYALPPTAALIMLAGIYYGAQYGGSTTAILVNLPGEASSVVTCIDGYQMARQGRAGTGARDRRHRLVRCRNVATVICALLAAPLATVATQFGPAEYFSLMVLGLIGAVVIAHRSMLKAIGMVIVGLILGLVGTDVNTGAQRFTFGVTDLLDGIGFIVVAVGVFAISEIVANLEQKEKREVFTDKVGSLMPSREDPQAVGTADRARYAGRLGARHPAGRRGAARLVCGLRGREEGRQGPLALRQGRHRGRGRAGGCQQRGRADLLHSDAHARHSAQRGDGADDRRP